MWSRSGIELVLRAVVLAELGFAASGQTAGTAPSSFSISTPRPISPAGGTTNPSARETQRQNPYLGSVPAPNTGTVIQLSLEDAIARGLRYNLGLIESNQTSAGVHADRLRALASLLPDIYVRGRQAYEDLSYKEIGLKLPPIPGLPALSPTSGGFGYQDLRVSATQSLYDRELRDRYHAQQYSDRASTLSARDSRDVVVLAVGTAFLQVIASEARVETAKAQLTAAQELDQLAAHRTVSEVSPEIESLRARVQRQSAEQRLTNVTNELAKDRLTLARIIGLDLDQEFTLLDHLAYHPLTEVSVESATEEALHARSDLASAEVNVRAAESSLRAEKARRLPVVSVSADYGGAGTNLGNFNQVYSISGNIAVPIYTGGRIHADIERAGAELVRRRAEYEDLRGRVAYDVRVAWLDLTASDSSVKVAESNRQLAERALTQSRDRYVNGVTNYLEVVQAQEVVAGANENYIQSLYSFNVAVISLARSIGDADTRLPRMLGEK